MQEGNRSALSGVPRSLPAMIKALRIQEKARGVGFDWEQPEQVWEKVLEELNEFSVEVEKENHQKMEEEFGDLLFALVNFSRFKNINPEDALEKTNRKFIHRFTHLEEEAAKAGKKLEDMTLAEMDVYWNQAKSIPMK
jgi:XTP/dITP diphosphohydrolase